MGDGRINFKFTADDSDILNAANRVDDSLSQMADEAEKSGARIGAAFSASGLRDMTEDISELTKSIADQEGYVNSLKTKYSDLAKSAGEAFMSGRDEEYRNLNTEMLNLNATIGEESQSLLDLKGRLDEATSAQASFVDATSKSSNSLNINESFMMKLLGGTENYKNILSSLPGPITGVISGIGGITKASLAFIATPLGAVIAAVVLGLKALNSWFTSSAEGQREFTKITGYLSGVLGQLKEVVITVGKVIFEAFTNPKKAITDLWEAIKTNIMNRIEGLGGVFRALGKVISSTFSGDMAGAKEGLAELGDQILKTSTGVDNLAGKLKQGALSLHEVAKATQALKVAEEQLAIDRNKFGVEEAKLRAKADEAYQRYQKSGMKDRAALKEYEAGINQIYDKRENFAKEELRIKKELAAITTNSLEDNAEINDSEKALIALQSERIAALRRADRASGSITGREERQGETEAQKAEKAYLKAKLDQFQKLEDAKIALKRASIKDEDELRKFDLEQELKRIDLEKKAYLELALLKGEKQPDTEVFEERKRVATESSKEEEIKNTAEKNKKILEEYATFSEKYLRKVKELEKKKADIISAGGIEANVRVAETRVDEELKKLDSEYFKLTEGFKTFSNSLVNNSVDQLKVLLSKLKKELESSTEGVESESNAVLRAKIEELTNRLERSKISEDEDANKLKKWQETNRILTDVVKTTKGVVDGFDGISESVKRAIADITLISSSTIAVIDGLGTLGKKVSKGITDVVEDSTEAVEGVADVAKAAISGVEKASIILTIVSAAIQVATTIANLFISASRKRREEQEKLRKEIIAQEDEYNTYLRERLLLFEESKTIFGLDEYGKAIEAARLGVDTLASLKDKLTGGKKDSDWILPPGLIQNMGKLQNVYSELAKITVKTGSKETGGVFGLFTKTKDVYESILKVYPNLIDKQGKFDLQVAKSIISTRTMSDESKRALQGFIDLAEQSEAAFKQVDDYLSNVFGALGSSMTESIVTAFRAGKSAATSFVDDIGALLEKLGQDMLYSVLLQPLFDTASKQLKEITEDITLSPEEQFKKMSKVLGELAKDSIAKQEQMSALLQQFKEDAKAEGLDIFKTEKEKAQAERQGKGIQALTQETGTRIEGTMTATSINTGLTADNTSFLVASAARVEPMVMNIRDTIDVLSLNTRKIYDEVVMIRQNTAYLPDMDRKLQQVVTNTSR